MRVYTRWIFFSLATIFNLALIYAFVAPERQQAALIFVAVTVIISGLAARSLQSKARGVFWDSVTSFSRDGWDRVAETDNQIQWARASCGICIERKLIKNPVGASETVLTAKTKGAFPGRVMVYRESLGDMDAFRVLSDPKAAADRFLEEEQWQELHGLSRLQDPIHSFYFSVNHSVVEVHLEGELQDEETVLAFLTHSFSLIERADQLSL